jgi:hypothetical protein
VSLTQYLSTVLSLAILLEIASLLVIATFFSIAAGVGAYVKGRFPGPWMLASFIFGPIPFFVLLLHKDE